MGQGTLHDAYSISHTLNYKHFWSYLNMTSFHLTRQFNLTTIWKSKVWSLTRSDFPSESIPPWPLITVSTSLLPIFIDMIAPKQPRVIHKLTRFSPETIVVPIVIGQSIYSTSTLVIALFCVHAPRGRYSDGKLHPTALLRMRGNYFRPYLSISACAIEVQHSNENSTIN